MAACLVTVGCVNAAGECLVPTNPADDSLPTELQGMNVTLLHSDDFDSQPDFKTENAVEFCIAGSGNGCSRLPQGWTDFQVGERFHPVAMGDSSLEPGLQINGDQPRGSSGKSLMVWDESYGTSSQWGSDAMLGKYLPEGHRDIYVEYWIKWQPGYRWHHMEPTNTHGINYAKVLRIGHRDEGKSPFSFSASGSNAPLVFLDASVTSTNQSDGSRSIRTGALLSVRCDPQETNYKCGSYSPGSSLRGYLNGGNASFDESFGDGGWHKLAARLRLNSGPGVSDGIVMAWFDNQLVGSVDNVPFRGTNAPDNLLNHVTLGGNMHNLPEPEVNRFEQWYAIDDVRIFALDP